MLLDFRTSYFPDIFFQRAPPTETGVILSETRLNPMWKYIEWNRGEEKAFMIWNKSAQNTKGLSFWYTYNILSWF